ncbi:MAG: hypothetical protein WC505_05180 [Patescibacteria group bacterium]
MAMNRTGIAVTGEVLKITDENPYYYVIKGGWSVWTALHKRDTAGLCAMGTAAQKGRYYLYFTLGKPSIEAFEELLRDLMAKVEEVSAR